MSYPFPKGPKLHPLMHDLRDEYVELKRPKRDLEAINRVLLDPTIPVTLYTSNRGCFKHRWESEAWQEFQKMSAEEQRPMVEQSMSQIIEKHRKEIETKQRIILKLEKKLNAREPKAKRKNLGGRTFAPASQKLKIELNRQT